MRPLQIGVLLAERREQMGEITIRELEERGAAGVVDIRTLYYSARDASPAPKLPDGWRLVRRPGPNGGGADFRWMIGQLDPTRDAILFEDDVQPCRNAVPAMMKIEVPDDCGAVSFYDGGHAHELKPYAGPHLGLTRVGPERLSRAGFAGAQALRIPAWLIARMQAGEFDPPAHGQDTWVGRVVADLGLGVAVLCPSLVQHVGEDSLCQPGANLKDWRTPTTTFPGEDFDALGEYPLAITPGPATPRPRITWCGLHGAHHANAIACPAV